MSLGYVSIIMSAKPDLKMKSCILKNASKERLIELIKYNLDVLDKMLDYNREHNIFLFRVSSGFVPFASHPVNEIDWCKMFKKEFKALGEKAKKYGIRLSMHPGQYTTLSSPDPKLVEKSIWDLQYQTGVLDCMELNSTNKIILHIGGKYDNKKITMDRFIEEYKKLPQNIKNRLIIENDDTNYTVKDVLYISKKTGAPILFDYFHHLLNHEGDDLELDKTLKKCMKTWDKERDGRPKIHYSQQATNKRAGSHSLSICVPEFLEFYKMLPPNIDVMLEVKDKDISALKCIEALKK
ncbi:MAG: UV DNA damage repair endonuclease UvsE [Clostridia bacterium]|nr:UV DNA damage repair endonuclease UvsE [Clostridia bacterium]